VEGADKQGIDSVAANAIFDQLSGFAGFGFCKSHAASFALIAYHTLHLKIYHAPAFYVALLNQQPMGFYSPEVIIGDAQRHGVRLLPPDISRSQWRYTVERTGEGLWAIRTGLSAVKELGEAGWERLAYARNTEPFHDLADIVLRTGLAKSVIQALIRAGALDSLGERRQLLWQLGEVDDLPNGLTLPTVATPVALPALSAWERTLWEYELLGLSPAGHLMLHYRHALQQAGIASTWQVKQMRAGQLVQVAGMVTVRQRPETAKGILFMSLEDESGLLDLIVYPDTYKQLRPTLRHELLIRVKGVVQRDGTAVNVLVQEAESLGVKRY
jgi:error-prone DNA polymerase